jgi:hypothetical protein
MTPALTKVLDDIVIVIPEVGSVLPIPYSMIFEKSISHLFLSSNIFLLFAL